MKPHRSRWKRLACTTISFLSASAAALTSTPPASADIFNGYNIGGRILDEYYAASAFNGQSASQYFGPATTPESDAARGGKWQAFQNSNSIYWHPNVSGGRANQIGGDIRGRWGQKSYENGPLMYPTSRESPTRTSGFSGTSGRFNSFEGGTIYWTPQYGPRIVWGALYSTWSNQDWEHGHYGFPQGDEVQCYDGNRSPTSSHYNGFGQRFEGGWIFYNSPGSFQLPYSSVNSAKQVLYRGTTKYGSQFSDGASFWNSLGRVNMRPQAAGEASTLDLSDYRDDATATIAYYQYRGSGTSGTLNFNDAYMGNAAAAMAKWVVRHELGHALGLDHSCQGQIMDPFYMGDNYPPLGELDQISYNNRWGW